MSEAEQIELNQQLTTIYGEERREYQNLESDFDLCKTQLLNLLAYIKKLNPNAFKLFAQYASKVNELTAQSATPDILITLGAAKKALEHALPHIMARHQQVDATKLNSFVVTKCYAGAYTNLELALACFVDTGALSPILQVAKRELLNDLAKQFLISKELIEHRGNEIHMTNALFNYVADDYGLVLQEDKFASNFTVEQLVRFKEYLHKHVNVPSLILKLSQLLTVPAANITDMTQFQELEDFFQLLGEEKPNWNHYQLLYVDTEIDDVPVYVRKANWESYFSSVLALYLEKAGYISGATVIVDDRKLIYSSEYLVDFSNNEFSLLSDEELFSLLEQKNLPIHFTSIIQLLSTQSLFSFYKKCQIQINEYPVLLREHCVHVLLSQSHASSEILDYLYAEVTSITDPQQASLKQHQFRRYVMVYGHKISLVQMQFLMSLTSEEQQRSSMLLAMRNDYADVMDFLLQCNLNIPFNEFGIVTMAIHFNATKVLSMLHQKGVNFNEFCVKGMPIAAFALQQKKTRLLRALCQYGVDLNRRVISKQMNANIVPTPEVGDAPVHIAATNGDGEALKILKEFGADLNAKNQRKMTAAHIAYQKGDTDLLRLLHQLGAIIPTTLVHQAVKANDIKMLCMLKELNVSMDGFNEAGDTPVNVASPEMLIELGTLGANLYLANKEGDTLAGVCAEQGGIKHLQVLKQFKINFNEKDSCGRTAAYCAAEAGRADSIRTLHTVKNVDFNIPDPLGRTPAFIAAANGHVKALQNLANYRVNLNTPDANGFSPAYMTVVNNQIRTLQILIKSHADLSQIKENAEELLEIVVQNDYQKMFFQLLGMKIDFLTNSVNLQTMISRIGLEHVLFQAAQNDNLCIFQTASDLGWDFNVHNMQNETPAFIAARNGHHTLLSFLMNKDRPLALEPVLIHPNYLKELVKNKNADVKKRAIERIVQIEKGLDYLELTSRDIAEIMGHQHIVDLFTVSEPKRAIKFKFFSSAVTHANLSQEASSSNAMNVCAEPEIRAGKRQSVSELMPAVKKKKDRDEPSEAQHQYRRDSPK